ncbi:hypothetical protein OAO87_03190 [bacterium]|nr:hypothetical protein [bacterium]
MPEGRVVYCLKNKGKAMRRCRRCSRLVHRARHAGGNRIGDRRRPQGEAAQKGYARLRV